MGGLCGKPSSPEGERRESPKSRQGALVLSRGNSGKRVESFRAKDKRENGDARVGYIDKRTNNSRRVRDEQSEKKKTQLVDSIPASISSAAQAELIAAGWPSWLVAAAAESIKGWIPRRADTFEKLEKIGQGTYSSVYKARDVLNKKFVALKRVRFDNLDRESVKFMAREILILRRLDHPNIIKLEGLVTSRTSSSLYLVFEYMEHDLTGLASLPGVKFTEPQVEQLHKIFKLCGSPSEDYWKKSKLHKSTVFKPKQPYRRRLAETFKDFPDAAVGLIETLLAVDPAQRGTAASALKSEAISRVWQFFIVEPHACDPATLPKYPPSKEIDAKLRGEEARRQGVGIKDDKVERDTSRPRDSRAVPAPDANAELATSLQKRGRSNPKTRSEQFNRQKDEAASGFPIGPPRATQASKEGRKEQIEQPPNRASYSGPLVPGVGWTKAAKKNEAMPVVLPRTNLSSLSGLVASRTLTSEDSRDKFCPPHQAAADQARRVSETFDEWGSARKQDIKHQTQGTTGSRQMGNLLGSTKESILNGQGFQGKGNKIHFSGPLLVPSNNVDQMLKDHDRQIQEAARRARIEKARVGIIEPQVTPNPMYVGNRGAR
uniref:Protein kinase domain-containing protein n=1 Tax=Daucus carota subsp. sativus TaxID=79200 RepID=A0A164W7G2_DAUCS